VIPDTHYALVRFGPNLLEKNPEAGKRFMVAYLKAVRQYNQGKTARNLDILAKHTKLDKDLLNTACWAQLRNDGHINVQSLIDFQDWALQRGLLDKKIPEDRLNDPSFLKYANEVLDSK
jgi:NitT/TauT family transport system substrate-binding protein